MNGRKNFILIAPLIFLARVNGVGGIHGNLGILARYMLCAYMVTDEICVEARYTNETASFQYVQKWRITSHKPRWRTALSRSDPPVDPEKAH